MRRSDRLNACVISSKLKSSGAVYLRLITRRRQLGASVLVVNKNKRSRECQMQRVNGDIRAETPR